MKIPFLSTTFLILGVPTAVTVAFAHPKADANAEAQFNHDFSLISRAVGDSCNAPEGTGECINSASCEGITYNNLCPKDPANIKCCIVKTCKTKQGSGFCRSKSRNSCSSGSFIPGACPGSSDIQCCVHDTNPPVNFPTGGCKPYVIDAGKKILAQFPGLVHTVWCYANKPGEHGEGRALDFMHKPHEPNGRELAEWVMNNSKSLDVMYIIWEQRIWNASRREPKKPWNQWRKMEDRGSCTANHCDHVHVSFN